MPAIVTQSSRVPPAAASGARTGETGAARRLVQCRVAQPAVEPMPPGIVYISADSTKINRPEARIAGVVIGSVTRSKACIAVAPEVRAAASSDESIARRLPTVNRYANGQKNRNITQTTPP